MNFDQARNNMVEQQVRTWEVLDPDVLDVIGRLPREDFVLPQYRKLAYADMMLPIGHDQFMMKPIIEGRLLQALDLGGDDEVLEIGTGSGYLTACLAALSSSVLTVDLFEGFVRSAEQRLSKVDAGNVTLEVGDVLKDWEPGRAFDAVAVTGSARAVPEQFRRWVKPGGRLFMVRGDSPVMEGVVLMRLDNDDWSESSLFETDLPRLVGAEDPESLKF